MITLEILKKEILTKSSNTAKPNINRSLIRFSSTIPLNISVGLIRIAPFQQSDYKLAITSNCHCTASGYLYPKRVGH